VVIVVVVVVVAVVVVVVVIPPPSPPLPPAPPYKGVVRVPNRKDGSERWRARTRVNGKTKDFGTWPTAREAALARDRGMREYGLDPSRLIFPHEVRGMGEEGWWW